MNKSSDVIVVGGGVIGSSVAYYLSKEGFQVTVLERGDIASGTSSACDGNILVVDKQPGFDSQLGYASQKLYRTLQDELGYDLEYRQLGSTLAVENHEQEVMARDWVRRLGEAGIPMRYIEADEVHEYEPNVAPDIIGLVECGSDASLNPMAVVFGFAQAAKRNGAVIRPFAEVKRLLKDHNSGEILGVETSEGTVLAPRVVLAAGVWTPPLAATAGVEVPIIPRKGHILVAERTFQVGTRKMQEFGYLMAKFGGKRDVDPEIEKYGVAMVFEPTPHGNFLIGSSREFVGFDTSCNREVLRFMAKRAIRFFPCIRNVNVIRSYAGLRPYTPDHLPIISEVPSVPGLYIAAGHEGDGIGLAPITGVLISQMLTGKETSVPVTPLSIERFRKSRKSSPKDT